MRLRTKLVLAISGLVFLIVCALSWIFLNQLVKQRIAESVSSTSMVAHQISFATLRSLETNMQGQQVDAGDPTAVRAAVAKALRGDQGLIELMNSAVRYSPTVYDVSIAYIDGVGLLSTDPENLDKTLPRRPDFAQLENDSLFSLLRVVFGPPRVYDVTLPLERSGQPFATVRVGVRTTFLRYVVEPWLITAFTYIGIAILCSIVVAALLANLALNPLAQIGSRLDALERLNKLEESDQPEQGQADQDPQPNLRTGDARSTALAPSEPMSESGKKTVAKPGNSKRKTDEVALVSHKIERIGQRMRNVEEVFSAMKEGLDQILTNLEDGLLLFTRDSRAVLVSDSVERFLGIPRSEILGSEIHEIFIRGTRLGMRVREAFDAHMALVQEEVTTETGRHIQVSLDFIYDEQPKSADIRLGALLTLHDLESVHEIESELEISRRLAAIGRLTAGVGHEVKNPINAIVVHLELMRNKLGGSDAGALRHLDVISSEIQRLDRVVETLVDFSRPVELQLQEQDLRDVIAAVLTLASAELGTRKVQVESNLPVQPVMVNVDADLLKQALLNIVINGAQAMPDGGKLAVRLVENGHSAMVSIGDNGSGIPADIRDKIFDLYFTTKKEGSGIGLAMTYRIVQLHNGSIDVDSSASGTVFTLHLPLAPQDGRQRVHPARHEEIGKVETE